MEEDQEKSKHMCKFCSKSFPTGRSLGGHMRSHLVTVPSSDGSKSKQKLPTIKALKSGEEEERKCRECGKRFHSRKAMFGHMKCHSVNGRTASSVVEDSWDTSKQITDTLSDNEASTSLHRRKQSANLISMSKFEQMEQEEVALSLIILSRDKGDYWSSLNSVIESSDNNSALSQPKKLVKVAKVSGKNSENSDGKLEPAESDAKLTLAIDNKPEKTSYSHDTGCGISEVNSPRNESRKRKCIDAALGSKPNQDLEQKNKFRCSVCEKGFPSYQALGGHRASNKKFRGSCAAKTENSLESKTPPNQTTENMTNIAVTKDHECSICFKVFSSGQALGGHKRSHLTNDHPPVQTQKPVIRSFLDLNLPAPDEEDCNNYKPCWVTILDNLCCDATT